MFLDTEFLEDSDDENYMATVKFLENKEVVDVPLKQILELKNCNNLTNVPNNKVYTCLYNDDKYQQWTKYGVQVGRIFSKYFLK